MGDRDGDDDRNEAPTESNPDDSTEDQQVPSSTAADAKANDESEAAADGADDSGDGKRHRSPEEAATSGHSDDDDDAVDDEDDDSLGGVEDDDTPWSPPTSDEVDEQYDRDPESVVDDDPEDWWEEHPPENVVDEESTGDTSAPEESTAEATGDSSDDETVDDEDLEPAARRNQMEKAKATHREVNRSKGPSDRPADDASEPESEASGTPKDGAGGAPKGGAASATARPSPTEQRGYDSDVEPATAPDDEEMPLTEHVEEMALRLLAVGLVMFGVAGIVVFYADNLINFLWYSFLGDAAACPGPNCEVSPRVYHPLSLVLARLKVSTLVGLIVALPVGVYQTYRFMRPGLYPRERRYYLAAVPTSVVLAVTGVGFAYFAVLPSLFAYFTQYSEQAAVTAFSLTETFNLIVLMLGFFALIFQIPLLVMLAIMMGVTSRQWMEDRRLYFWGGFAAVAFVFSPDPTGMAPLIVAVTMIILFEGTLTLLRWTGTGSPIPTAEEAADARPLAYVAAALGGYIASSGPIPPGYYDALPPQVTEALANTGGPIATPAILGGALIALFEIGALLLRRFGRSRRALKLRLAVDDARIPIWLGAAVVGYFGSPDPTLVIAAENLALPPAQAGLVAVGLIVLYELFVAVLRWRGGDGTTDEATADEA